MKKLFAIFALLMATQSFAATPDPMNELTDVQRAEVSLHIAQKAAEAKIQAPSSPKQVEQWVSYGTQIGQALAGTARELGIVANEFIQTPAGKLTMAMIIWKVMGHDIVHVGLAMMMFFTMIPLWIYLFRRMCIIKGFEYRAIQFGEKTVMKRIPIYHNANDSDVAAYRGWMFIILGILLALITIIGLT